LSLLDKPSFLLHQALNGRFTTATGGIDHAMAGARGFTHLPLPGGHDLLLHADGTVLLSIVRGGSCHWFPVALRAKAVDRHAIAAHSQRLVEEALAWIAQPHERSLGWGTSDLVPVHTTTADPWQGLPTTSVGGALVLRARAARFQPFFALAQAFLERHPRLVWDHLHYTMGMVGVRGQWTLQPHLTLFFSKRQGTFAATDANKAWARWSAAFLVEAMKRRTLPATDLAGWYWNVERYSQRPYRSPYTLTLAMGSKGNPTAQGLAHGLDAPTTSHERLALHAAFQQAAPDTYQMWMAG
jgi:hypothetical protein